MDLEQAVQKHSEWKIRFRTAISKQESLDAATIARDNCCDLGKWLHGEGKSKFGNLKSHLECVTRHAAFHIEAGKVATAINQKKYAEAEQMIAASTPYTAASAAVAGAILKLKKEVQL